MQFIIRMNEYKFQHRLYHDKMPIRRFHCYYTAIAML